MEKIPGKKSEKETFLNLIDLRKQLVDQIDQLEDRFDENRTKESLSVAWLEQEKQTLIKNFITNLLKQKESFSSIFETEKGSIYFISKNGQSWRFKKEGDSFKEQPILNKIIFLSPGEAKKYIQFKKCPLLEEYLVGMEDSISPECRNPYLFKKSTLSHGNIPLEIGSHDLFPLVFEEDEKTLKIIGTRMSNGTIEKFFASGTHNGHPISKIY